MTKFQTVITALAVCMCFAIVSTCTIHKSDNGDYHYNTQGIIIP